MWISIEGRIEPIHNSSCILSPRSGIINYGFITTLFFKIIAPYVLSYLIIFIIFISFIPNYVHIITIIV